MGTKSDTTRNWFDWAAEHLESWKGSHKAWRSLFTPGALEANENASHAASSLKHDCVGAEHLLAGLLKLNRGSVPGLLKASGLDLPALRKEIETAHGGPRAERPAWPRSYTPRFSRIIEAAREEAKIHGDASVDVAHLFLGLLREREGVAADILKMLQINPDVVRHAILQEMAH